MRWDVRNTFLVFYDDDDQEFAAFNAFRSQKRSTSAPALLTKAQIPKAVITTQKSLTQGCFKDSEAKAIMKLPKGCPEVHTDAPKRGGGLRRVAVRQTPAQSQQAMDLAAHTMPFMQLEPSMSADMDAPATFSPAADVVLDVKSKRSRRRCKPRQAMASDNGPRFTASGEAEDEAVEDRSVTVMVRHIACCYTQQQVMSFLDELGLKGKYNFVHVPLNSKKTANLGYFFANFASPQHVEEFRSRVEGTVFGTSRTTKKCEVSVAHMQGRVHMARTNGRLGN